VSDQQHHQVLEVDRFGNVVWMFRNLSRAVCGIHARLENGLFQKRGADRSAVRLAGARQNLGGRRPRDMGRGSAANAVSRRGRRPRGGAFCPYQVIGVVSGGSYRLTGEIKTCIAQNAAVAFFQLAFLDGYGGLIHDVMQSPKGRMFAESSDWRKDTVEARARPARRRARCVSSSAQRQSVDEECGRAGPGHIGRGEEGERAGSRQGASPTVGKSSQPRTRCRMVTRPGGRTRCESPWD